MNVLDNLTVAENVFLGREPRSMAFLIDRKKLNSDTDVHLKRLGLDIPADTPLAELSIAQQQMVEIAKALSLNARLVIMDEPTSSLTLTETERLLDVIKELRAMALASFTFPTALARSGRSPTASSYFVTARMPEFWNAPTSITRISSS